MVDLLADAALGLLRRAVFQLGAGHGQVAAAAQKLELDTVYFLNGKEG